uniref:Protein kinase domain-containing protein n=1 Tax=Lactuca sativa TaxID=4236 RepID=A0A9R1VQ98_LACSA|nr:hypothetical protein LSAT_V11C400169980 [Lactuca sativa]
MVSSQLTALIENKPFKSSKNYFQFPKNPPNETSDTLELDFSDTFGPLPLPAGNSEIPSDDPVVIYSRSHSLVGPTPCVSHLLNLRKLTICETDESLEDFSDVIDKEIEEEDSENGCKVKTIGLEDFEVMKVVGQGAFGKVYQVRKRDSLEIYAMKVVRKDKIVEKNHAEYMKAERDILTKIDHPFIVQLRYSFQLYHHGLFREDLARIYAAEIVSAVSHLHANGIMHRDLKPENILLDVDGHALLTDFGLAKEFDENARSNSLCGTVEYMSPEIILGKGHDKAADWWSNLPRFLPENLENNKMLYERVSVIAVNKGCTPSQLALAWVHHQGKDVVPIPGTTKIENLQQNIGALFVKLAPQDMAELESPPGNFLSFPTPKS